jgi:hypothetical protein
MLDPLSPEVTYATKGNVKYPGTQTQATAAEGIAQTRINAFVQTWAPLVSVTVGAGSIPVSN